MERTLSRFGLLTVVTLLAAGCFAQPTREELLEAERLRQEQCDDMLRELEAEDRPLIRASLQENYNQTCVEIYPNPPGR
ncbi:MAG: hypothetical protein AAGA23_22585 [Pseudomonadota bacterium]